MKGPEYPLIERALPDDNAKPAEACDLLARYGAGAAEVLDLGCGDGRGLDIVRRLVPGARYIGLDIEDSPEVGERIRNDGEFISYDGVNLPFEDESIGMVYSCQVFEHIRHPDRVVEEIFRVLRPGGWFVGSLSNLEPYHSFSIFNFTPYGVFRLIEDNGLELVEMRPGAEGIGLIVRQITNRKVTGFKLGYPLVEIAGKLKRWDARQRNYLKLRLSGHIAFAGRKPG